MRKIKLNFDGACEPKNPGGNMGFGAVIRDLDSGEILKEIGEFVPADPANTNNVAEYRALILGLEWLLANGYAGDRVKVEGDSMMVVKQMRGDWGASPGTPQKPKAYFPYYQQAAKLRLKFTAFSIAWIPREQNADADKLSKSHITN